MKLSVLHLNRYADVKRINIKIHNVPFVIHTLLITAVLLMVDYPCLDNFSFKKQL